MQPAVFLDRDGVLNELVLREGRSVSPRTLNEFVLMPGVPVFVEALKRAGLLVVVVTNQPDIKRGLMASSELEDMHAYLRKSGRVNAIYACLHDDLDGCDCRKPKPGLLLRASQELKIHLPRSYLVGDTWKDIGAGHAAGCRTILVRRNSDCIQHIGTDFIVSDLTEAAELILSMHCVPPPKRENKHAEG